MFDVVCLDAFGNAVNYLTQWDVNQKLYIEDTGFETAPVFQFCNKCSDRALGVQSEMDADGTIVVDVPNELLTVPYAITCYVYLHETDNTDAAKTVEVIHIPVRERVQPSDYELEDNVNVVWITELIEQIQELDATLTENEDERISNETVRIANENQRITNEQQRQISTAAVITASQEQTAAAKTATEEANEATERLNAILFDIDGGNAYTDVNYMFQIDGGNCESNDNGS